VVTIATDSYGDLLISPNMTQAISHHCVRVNFSNLSCAVLSLRKQKITNADKSNIITYN